MPTLLTKPVIREVPTKGRTFIVELLPGGTISMRMPKSRLRYTISLQGCWNLAILQEAERINRERKQEYEAKKKAGAKRLRKPKQCNVIDFYSPLYRQALKK